MQLNPYLTFNGNCAEAFKFYEKALGAKVVMMMTYGDTPAAKDCAPGMSDKVIHARMTIDGQVVMASDAPAGRYSTPQGTVLNLGVKEPAEAERIFQALSDGATITMPIGETFWAKRFGMLTDRFGTPWMVNCEKPM